MVALFDTSDQANSHRVAELSHLVPDQRIGNMQGVNKVRDGGEWKLRTEHRSGKREL